MELLLTVHSQDYNEFQAALDDAGMVSQFLRDVSAHDPNLYSDSIHRLIIDLTTLASAPSITAVIIAYIRSRRIHLTMQDPESGKSFEFDGPDSAIAEVKKLVEESQPEQLP
jgi:hypothetical protein